MGFLEIQYKNVGLGFRTPKTAIEGSYIGESEANEKTALAKARDDIEEDYGN